MENLSIRVGRMVGTGPFLLGIALVCAVLLALPGQTVTTRYVNDLFVILDGAHRIAWGQVPNRDFHSALGPLTHYVPAAGYWLTGSFGAAMPAGSAILTLALAPVLAHILASRLHPFVALLYGAFLLLILAVPMNLGEAVTSLSFAMFYNRIGWVALGALLVMYLLPRRVRPYQERLDAACASLLTLVMLYTKATYGLVALAFLVFMLSDARQRRWAAWAIALTLVAALLVEAGWRSSAEYVADMRMALDVGGPLRGTWGQIIDHILGNLADYVLVCLFAGLALWRTRSLRDGLFYGFCAVIGFLIINHNFQAWGIVTLHAAAAVAAETILRRDDDPGFGPARRSRSVAAGARLLFLALVLPTIVHCALALGLHTVAASARSGEALPLSGLGNVRLANLWTWNDYDAATPYLASIQDGIRVLAGLNGEAERVFVLDRANPFSLILDLPPARGDMPRLQWERTVNATAHVPPEDLLADVRIVMEPKPTTDAAQSGTPGPAALLSTIYGPYVTEHFDLVRETANWKVHRRRPSSETKAPQHQVSRP